MTVLEALQRAPLFKDFTDAGLETLASVFHERAVAAGTVLFAEDDVGESLLVVKSGSVRLVQAVAGGGAREVATLGPGEHAGDLAVLAPTVRLVTAVAASDCELLELSRRDLFRKAQEKPVTCFKLAVALAGEVARHAAASKAALRDALSRARA